MVSFLLVLGSLGGGCGGLLSGGLGGGGLLGGGMGLSLLVPVSEGGEESDAEWSLWLCVSVGIVFVVGVWGDWCWSE